MILFCLGIFAFASVFIYLVRSREYEGYAKHPTFEEYKQNHPELVKKGSVECFNCGSTKIQSKGLYNAVDKKRIHSCIMCGKVLYKTLQ